ncbi:MAG: 50S ribosomal protein L3 N(5)-glutamine methyltransferase [Gammaproteobacteria bacterium]|nr:50S ribosomal protein L3 N(5)-glutamine methyltransferase [Gammaproteobacteria bacterium]NND37408.1 50S ribosomal protein L3 N(5)-glutamine methyltransferase [Gammaproteobacteria bacterium]
MGNTTNQPQTIGALIEYGAAELERAGVFFGHGTDNAIDEAASLVYCVAGLDHDAAGPPPYDESVDPAVRARVLKLLETRIADRVPMPYLLHEAWFAGLRFYVDERVLIPRSPFAELIGWHFEPWLDPARIRRILEIGTGSGCIAIACALAFPDASVVATDLSEDALAVARINIRSHGLGDRVDVLQADLFDGVEGRFDLIASNPPYVPAGKLAGLPPEYAHEPGLALGSGADGLESTRHILQDAPRYLAPGGLLAIEVGCGWPALERAFPDLPFVWPEFESGGEGIALINAADLGRARN